MANEMNTYIMIRNTNRDVISKLKEIFHKEDDSYEVNTVQLANRIYGMNLSYKEDVENWDRESNWISQDEWDAKIGPKWIYTGGLEYYEDDSEEATLNLRSAWYVPIELIKGLFKVISDIKPDCYISATYEDESYDPMGAFILAKDHFGGEYLDMEDLDEEIDYDKLWEDDEYRESLYDNLNELSDALEESYINYRDNV